MMELTKQNSMAHFKEQFLADEQVFTNKLLSATKSANLICGA